MGILRGGAKFPASTPKQPRLRALKHARKRKSHGLPECLSKPFFMLSWGVLQWTEENLHHYGNPWLSFPCIKYIRWCKISSIQSRCLRGQVNTQMHNNAQKDIAISTWKLSHAPEGARLNAMVLGILVRLMQVLLLGRLSTTTISMVECNNYNYDYHCR